MNRLRFSPYLSILLIITSAMAQPKLEVKNNQPFPIRQPVLVRKFHPDAKASLAQQVGDDAVVLIDVPASATARPLEVVRAPASYSAHLRVLDDGALELFGGRMEWGIVLEKIEKAPADADAGGLKHDYPALFKPLPLKFTRTSRGGNLFDVWTAQTSDQGVKLVVNIDDYHMDGIADVRATFTNESAPQKLVYCAVICRWSPAKASARSVGYDNHIIKLDEGAATPFRAGEGRHLFVERGVDWINTRFGDSDDGGASLAWLNDFTRSFTVHRDATAKLPPRWIGANLPQLGQEALVKDGKLYSITEIARPNIRSYAGRLDSNCLPGPDQPLTFTSRLMAGKRWSDEQVDQQFVAYVGYNEQSTTGDTTKLFFGVPHVKFGTAYFPYSTLGENFEAWHMPGQNQNTYWPLSADTVTHWKLFADDIKRDLRIAKAMGFESIRMHHLEMIATLPKAGQGGQDEYLDFFFAELKHLGLTALLDVKLPPARIAELVKKYRPQVDGVEIDNEVLIFGINDPDVPVWKEIYRAVKEVAPDMPVHLTAHTNTGAFERLRKLGVPFDRLGLHAYQDSLDAIPSGRDFALAVADEASEIGKPPIITEWNWRFLTRLTEEDRAKVYPPIFENILKTRCMPIFYQFQFQESLAMASRTLRGIRHYELLNLSRRPRAEAMEFEKLVHRYGDPQAAHQKLVASFEDVQTDRDGKATIAFKLTNATRSPMTIDPRAETPPGMNVLSMGKSPAPIEPGQTITFPLVVQVPAESPPGFYHVFLRIGGAGGDDEKDLRYAWAEVRKTGNAPMDKGEGAFPAVAHVNADALDFSFDRDVAVVYGKDASGWEVESAWLFYQTLESATGRRVKIFQLDQLPPDLRERGNLIVVGTPKSNPLVKQAMQAVETKKAWVASVRGQGSEWLVIAGDDEANVNLSAIDTVLRYWKHAKDSGCRRIPLTDKPIEKGADPGALP